MTTDPVGAMADALDSIRMEILSYFDADDEFLEDWIETSADLTLVPEMFDAFLDIIDRKVATWMNDPRPLTEQELADFEERYEYAMGAQEQ
jgi:hypothetical protein